MIPCKDCCRPATYVHQFGWTLRSLASKNYNTDSRFGIVSSTTCSISTTNTLRQFTCCQSWCGWTAPDPFISRTLSGWDMTANATFASAIYGGLYESTCQPDCDCCICSAYHDFCSPQDTYYDMQCWNGYPTEPSGDDYACSYMYFASGTTYKIDETELYATGVKITGKPDEFVGFPVEIEGCNAIRKGLRKMYAKCTAGILRIRWFVVKEFMDGDLQNILYTSPSKDFSRNEIGGWVESANENNCFGVKILGSEDDTRLWTSFTLGDGEGDGSFEEGDGWYDITNKEVEFNYSKPNTAYYRMGFDFQEECGGMGAYCPPITCDDTHGIFESPHAQILYSTDVEDPITGAGIWDIAANGSNFGGTYSVHVQSPPSATHVTGTCTVS
jgi:hypothetical protein